MRLPLALLSASFLLLPACGSDSVEGGGTDTDTDTDTDSSTTGSSTTCATATDGGGCSGGTSTTQGTNGGTSTSTGGTSTSTGGTSTSTGGTGGSGGSTGGGMGGWDGDYPSCAGFTATACGGDDCCAVDEVPGGWFAMGRGQQTPCAQAPTAGGACSQTTATCLSGDTTWGCPAGTWLDLGGDDSVNNGGADEVPEHGARVGFYGLDRYEVTVGRMRNFVDNYDKTALLTLLGTGAGAHPDINGTAWQGGWDSQLPADAAALRDELTCDATETWTDAAGANETFPINCVSWYTAYAFCAWDEARLPTAAEWERAAIGGDENRLYPWGDAAPSAATANYNATDGTPSVDVFAKPAGAGRYGQENLAGSVWEWVFDTHDPDWYANAGNDCQDCANTASNGARTMRGGDFQYNAVSLRGAERFPGTAGADWLGAGIRCARD